LRTLALAVFIATATQAYADKTIEAYVSCVADVTVYHEDVRKFLKQQRDTISSLTAQLDGVDGSNTHLTEFIIEQRRIAESTGKAMSAAIEACDLIKPASE
jgi:hypothetical protein